MGILENKAWARLFYRYLSRVYDRVNPFIWNKEMRDEALEMLDIQQDDRVLNVGRGTGFGIEGLLRYTGDVYGLDQSVHQMRKTWEKFGKHDEVRFYRGDAEQLPFVENSFNVIWPPGSIEYQSNPVTALEEFRRAMKLGDKAFVVGLDDPKFGAFQKLTDAIIPFYDEEETDQMFEAAGFVNIEHHVLQHQPGSPRAIVTIARAPEE